MFEYIGHNLEGAGCQIDLTNEFSDLMSLKDTHLVQVYPQIIIA
jgi:hypothetical protein